MKMETSKST